MIMTNIYENLIFETIASHISLELTSLRLFPTVPSLPKDDRELFNLFDIIPSSGFLFDTNKDVPRFSSTYGQLLNSQKESFTTSIAKKNFENQKYWLTSQLPKTPLYAPSSVDISDGITRGSSFNFEFDSSNYPSFTDKLFPSFPYLILNQFFLLFNQIAVCERFVFKLHFDKMANIPVIPGGWFTKGTFTNAYNNKEWDSGPGTITWESLFGQEGILKFICNGILTVYGMVLEIQSFGKYDNTMLNALKSNQVASIWPFYLNVENLIQDYVLGADESIKITIKTPSSEILLLAMGVANV